METSENRITYNDIDLLSPYEIKHIKELKIVSEINNHTTLYLSGLIPEDKEDSYIKSASADDKVEVVQIDGASKVRTLFKGVVSNIAIRCVKGIYYLEVEAQSHTSLMDVKRQYRSFQNKQMLYDDLIKTVVKDYSGVDYKDFATMGESLNEFTVQYNETDWQFLKRMASRFGAVLLPRADSDGPKFFFGIPDEKEGSIPEETSYIVERDILSYLELVENDVKDLEDFEFTFYEVESSNYLNLGDGAKFKDKSMVVVKSTVQMVDGTLKYIYLLAPKNGVRQKRLQNPLIVGAAIEGKVLETSGDMVKVHLEIDSNQSASDACFFQYTTNYTAEGNTGWYCMPEADDYVKLYFPDEIEENAVVVTSARKCGDGCPKTAEPNIKYLGTNRGKELKMAGKDLTFSAKEGQMYIKLDEENGIIIESDKQIFMSTEKDFTLDADTLTAKAQESILLCCGENSSIALDGTTGMTHFQAAEVKVEGYIKAMMSLGDIFSMVKDSLMMPFEVVKGLYSMACLAVDIVKNKDINKAAAVLSSLPFVVGAKKLAGLENTPGEDAAAGPSKEPPKENTAGQKDKSANPQQSKEVSKETDKSGDKTSIGSVSDFKKKYGEVIDEMAEELDVDPNLLAGVILVESSGSGFVNEKLIIRFENHIFVGKAGHSDLFIWGDKKWQGHKWRKSTADSWKAVHTGSQESEYAAFEFALSLNEDAAYQSISMGMGQIMGFNYKAAGYGSAKEMFDDFSKGNEQQLKGMITFFKNYNNGKTLKALQKEDLESFVTQYNGSGQVDTYTSLMKKKAEAYKNAK